MTKMSSRGQVVIPQEIREKEGLKEGERFIVVDINGNIILKRVKNLGEKIWKNLKATSELCGKKLKPEA